MIDVRQITDLHRAMLVRWSAQEIDNIYHGFLAVVCQHFGFLYRLWREEENLRRGLPHGTRHADANHDRDQWSHQRQAWLDQMDDYLAAELETVGAAPPLDAPLNTETAGNAIDRLAILALHLHDWEVQLQRAAYAPDHRHALEGKLGVCLVQHEDLACALQELLDDLFAGRKRHKAYGPLKRQHAALLPFAAAIRKAG